MDERDDPHLGRRAQMTRAARLMELLGLSEDELCRVLDEDPLALLSGQVEHRAELPILLDLLDEAAEQAGPAVLRRWVRTAGSTGRPIDQLLRRDFVAFENSLARLEHHYGRGGRLDCGPRALGGFRVRVEIPYRAAEEVRA